jgi:hypothetical protein
MTAGHVGARLGPARDDGRRQRQWYHAGPRGANSTALIVTSSESVMSYRSDARANSVAAKSGNHTPEGWAMRFGLKFPSRLRRKRGLGHRNRRAIPRPEEGCQSALERDPGSACNRDPRGRPRGGGGGLSCGS